LDVTGFCKVATLEDLRAERYVLNPGRYVGGVSVEDTEGVPFDERLPALIEQLRDDINDSSALTSRLLAALATIESPE